MIALSHQSIDLGRISDYLALVVAMERMDADEMIGHGHFPFRR